MSCVKLKLSSPWVTFTNQFITFFEQDSEIEIKYDYNSYIKLYVDNPRKAEALAKILPRVKAFNGGHILDIQIYPSNYKDSDGHEVNTIYCSLSGKELEDTFTKAFENNPVLSFAYTIEGMFNNPMVYVIFANEVVQFFNDNLADIYGNLTTLYQEMAEDVFDNTRIKGVFYCTERKPIGGVGKPLGEWP